MEKVFRQPCASDYMDACMTLLGSCLLGVGLMRNQIIIELPVLLILVFVECECGPFRVLNITDESM